MPIYIPLSIAAAVLLAVVSASANLLLLPITGGGGGCASTSKWDPANKATDITLSPDNCTATTPSGLTNDSVRSAPTSYSTAGGTAKVYFELEYLAEITPSNGYWFGGVGVTTEAVNGVIPGLSSHGMSLEVIGGGSPSAQFKTALGSISVSMPACVLSTPGAGVWIGFAFIISLDNLTAWCTVNNGTTWNTGGTDSPVTNTAGFNNPSFNFTPVAVAFGGGDGAAAVINTSAPFHFATAFSNVSGAGYSAFASLKDRRQFAGDVAREKAQ